jgi:hypothetical protein
VRDRPHGGDGRDDRPVLVDELVLDHRQHHRGGPDLEEGGDLAEVGVAGDHVEPAVLLRVGVRLVAGVHDRTLQRRLEPDLLLEEVSALAELEAGVPRSVLATDLARTGEHLPGHEPRQQRAHERRERDRPVDEVVLVRAVGVALAVGVVLVDDDLLARGQEAAGRLHRTGEDPLPRLVRAHQLQRVRALGRRVLGMRVIDVVPGAVGQHGVDEVRLDLGRGGTLPGEAAGVTPRRLVLEVPADLAVLDVAVDQQRGRDDRVGIRRAAQQHSVLGLDPAHLGDGHAFRLPAALAGSVHVNAATNDDHRY